ncbi:MAG TPA: hypothetical protein VGA37_10950 [Gemmatimonadales bacterium]
MTDPHTNVPRTLPRWKLVLFSGILALVVLSVLEIGARVMLRVTRGFDGKHLYQYAFDPYKNILPTPNFVDRRGIEHNSVGFRRSSEVTREKPAGTYRVFLMGGSTAYGIGGLWPHLQRDYTVLDNSQTIDAYLERALADSLPGVNVEVINAAITSTWTHHHLIYLNQSILGYDPDMVLFLDGYNDFFHFLPNHDQFASYSYNLQSRVIMGDPTIKALLASNGWWLFRKSAAAHLASRAARTVVQFVRRDRGPAPLDPDSALAAMRRTFDRSALKMIERIGLILEAEHVHAVFMLQPLLVLERDRRGAPAVERELFEFNVASYRTNYEEFMRGAVGYVGPAEQAVADEVGAEFIDLTRIYDGVEGQVYTDYAHLTPLGNEVVALNVLQRVLPMIRRDLAEAADSAR